MTAPAQPTTTAGLDLDRLEREANERLRYFIARSAAQQLRRMRESWRAAK